VERRWSIYYYLNTNVSKGVRVRLTNGEKLFIIRRRRGINQADFAARYSVSHDLLGKIEKGERPAPIRLTVRKIPPLTVPEKIVVLRRRLGMSQRELAKKLGVTKQTMLKREQGVGDTEYVLSVLQEVSEVR
jgi:transcriptional regulator with XRE-family HTH domain